MVGELSGVPGLSRIANVLHIRRIEGELNVPCLSAEKQLLGCFFVFMEGDASDVVKRKRERFLSVY